MRVVFTILMWILMQQMLRGQVMDSISLPADAKLKQALNHYDSLQELKNNRINKLDSLNRNINRQLQKIGAVKFPQASRDSLKPTSHKSLAKLDSAKQKITHKIDSLSSLQLSTGLYSRKLDSLNQLELPNPLQKAESKISELQSDINSKASQPVEKVNAKLNQLTKESDGYGNLPSNINAPAVNQALPGIPALDVKLDGLKDQEFNSSLGKGNLDFNNNFDVKEKITSVPDTKALMGELDKVSEASDKVSVYAEDAKNISSGNIQDVKQIDQDVHSKVSSDELTAAQSELKAANQHMEVLRSAKDKETFKKETLAKAREVIIRQIALHKNDVAETVKKLSLHQERAGTIFSRVKGLPKRPRKEKKPPVIERIIPGTTVQVQKTNTWFVDFNPTLRYRIRSVFSAGVGWNERLVFDKDFHFYTENRVYGLRTFYELSVRKGLLLRADVECMNAFVPVNRMQKDIGERKQIWSYMAGLKKDFSFVPGVVGNVQFMYNLYDPERNSPYINRFNVRFGFEFPLKKKTKK